MVRAYACYTCFLSDFFSLVKYTLIKYTLLLLGIIWFHVFQGAGAFEVAARQYLVNEVMKTVQGVII